MKRKMKFMLAVALSLAMIMGSSLMALSATVVMRNPNATGVQLIGDTLIIQEDHNKFYVWGKSVMIQCPGVTDILPNNVTNMVDIQFNGNLYKGIKEVLIVSTPGKDDKVRLEEDSMIITGVTTPEQLQKVKSAIVSQPNTLVELKTALTGASQDLSATKNYIVGKHNIVQNENGNRVAKKEIQGTAELVIDQEVVQTVVEEAKANASESKPIEEKKKPTPTPTPTPDCQHDGGFTSVDDDYHECNLCHTKFAHGYVNYSGEYHKCTQCNNHATHSFGNGKCEGCNISCPECDGNPLNGCEGEWCYTCDLDYTGEHVWAQNGEYGHECTLCEWSENHIWQDGVCTVCDYVCLHGGIGTGTCPICHKVLAPAHTHSWEATDAEHHCTDPSCEKNTPEEHSYDADGYCPICMYLCTHDGETGTCRYCETVLD